MDRLQVKVKKLHPAARVPTYAHPVEEGELGADLYALSGETLQPGQISLVPTGIALELPRHYGALIEDRSGLALKGICTLAGVIDSGYRGEVKIVLVNLGRESYEIRSGDRIAQLRLTQCRPAAFIEVAELDVSTRGEGGFGSTGK